MLAGLHGGGSQQLPGEHRAPPRQCLPTFANQAGLCPHSPGTAGLRENKLHLPQPQFTKCQFQICDTWPLRNQLSFLLPGLAHKWDMIVSVTELSWSQRQHRAAQGCPSFPPATPQLLPCAMNCCRCKKAADSRDSCWPHLPLEEALSRFPPLADHKCLFSCILLPQLDLEGAKVYEWSL